ncbi:hypothetical protein G6F40_018155 [Rhizopus arrhizus]|nr:hypothetical protein G6F40_018155 [Rhizopus arrhizus]
MPAARPCSTDGGRNRSTRASPPRISAVRCAAMAASEPIGSKPPKPSRLSRPKLTPVMLVTALMRRSVMVALIA